MSGQSRPRRAVFLDRDGVINQMVYHADFGLIDSPQNPADFRLAPSAGEAIRQINELDLLAVVVSNQPGIAKGKSTAILLDAVTQKMHRDLLASGAHLDGVYYCLHHPEAVLDELRLRCDCRKPGAGMLFQAARELNIDLAGSYMIGDGLTDVLAGKAGGVTTILLGNFKCHDCSMISKADARPDCVAGDLLEAVRFVRRGRCPSDVPAAARA